MSKTISLKELPDTYISSGMTLPEVSKYINIPENTIQKWEKFFNLTPKTIEGMEKLYTKDKIQEFIKIKKFIERGRTLEEIRVKVYKMPVEVTSQPEPSTSTTEKVSEQTVRHSEKQSEKPIKQNDTSNMTVKEEKTNNPFTETHNFSEFKPEEVKAYKISDFEIKPFLSQLNKANERIGNLILEKAKIVENTAVEKADLLAKIERLRAKNEALIEEKEHISAYVKDKKEQIERFSAREDTLSRALMISQEILNKKEDEITQLRGELKACEQELQGKTILIQEQSHEIDSLLEKQNRKWWMFWKKAA